jgi:Xaa-Pro aminopeptidase
MDRTREASGKIEAVRDRLSKTGHSGVLLESQANFAWITAGGHSHVVTSEERGVAGILITADLAAIVTTNIEVRRLTDEQIPPDCFETIEYPWHSPEQWEKRIAEIASPDGLATDLPSENQIDFGPELTELRRVLGQSEIDRYKDLAQDAASAVESACRAVHLRESELAMAARVAAACCEKDILPVVNLVAADERIAKYRHPLPTANRVDRTLLVVLTARRNGLHASLTRTVCFGKPDPEQVARHRACARIDARMILNSLPGRNLSDIVKAGVDQYAAEGFPDEWRQHHQGGLTGYAGREILATPATGYSLNANQALAWNPSVAGAKSEDTILVREQGIEVLTSTGHWPQLEVELEGQTLARPALLTR